MVPPLSHVTPDILEKVRHGLPPHLSVMAAKAFSVLVETAIGGGRCPTMMEFYNSGIQSSSLILGKLADLGLIHVEVGGRNWRRVWICAGEHRGKATADRVPAVESYYVRGPGRPPEATHVA